MTTKKKKSPEPGMIRGEILKIEPMPMPKGMLDYFDFSYFTRKKSPIKIGRITKKRP